MKMSLRSLAYHRNGVMGEGFWAVAFTLRDGNRTRRMVAAAFDTVEVEPGAVHPCNGRLAVFDADQASEGDLSYPQNRWRGDNFEPTIRDWIAKHGESAHASGCFRMRAA